MEKEIVDIIKKVKITKRSKTLILDCPFGKDQVVYDLRDIKETYPNVTTLQIKDNIIGIHLLNRTFPNIRAVLSDSPYFFNRETMLIRTGIFDNTRGDLLNAFCLKPDEVLDLRHVRRICGMALDGCETSSINHADYIEDIDAGGLTGSYLDRPEIRSGDGPIMFGDCLIGFKDETTSFELTSSVKSVALAANFGKNMVQKLIVSDYHLLNLLCTVGDDNKICDTLVINDCSDFRKSISNHFCMNANHVEITSKNRYLKTKHDMIYGIEDHKLYASAWFLSGDIIIPKEVYSIGDDAFPSDRFTSIEIHPDVYECSSEAFVNPARLTLIKCHGNKLPEGLISAVVDSLAYTGCKDKRHYRNFEDDIAVIEIVSDNAHFFIPRDMTGSSELDELCSNDMSQVKKGFKRIYLYAGTWTGQKAVMVKMYSLLQDDEYVKNTLKREGVSTALEYIQHKREDYAILLVNTKLLNNEELTTVAEEASKAGMGKLVSTINSLLDTPKKNRAD